MIPQEGGRGVVCLSHVDHLAVLYWMVCQRSPKRESLSLNTHIHVVIMPSINNYARASEVVYYVVVLNIHPFNVVVVFVSTLNVYISSSRLCIT